MPRVSGRRGTREWGPSSLGRTLATAGLLVASGVSGCGVLNPNLLGAAGVNATSTVDSLPGNVVVVFINQTAFPARLNFSTVEAEQVTNLNRIATGPGSYIASAFTCDLAAVSITSFEVREVDVFNETDVDDVQLLGGLNFRCGSVISVILEGVPEDFQLNTQVF